MAHDTAVMIVPGREPTTFFVRCSEGDVDERVTTTSSDEADQLAADHLAAVAQAVSSS